MLAERNNDIRKAYSELQVMSKDEIARMAYEAREAEIHDQKTRMETARKEGIKEGSMKNAENLLKLGVNEEIVAKGTGLTIEQVLEIKKKLVKTSL